MTANAIVMMAGEKVARKINWGINECASSRNDIFPSNKVPYGLDKCEYWTTQGKTDIWDYYIVVYDGHDNGQPNPTAEWLTKVLPDGVNPTGNFVILHKKWNNELDVEENVKIEIGLKELRELFTPQ